MYIYVYIYIYISFCSYMYMTQKWKINNWALQFLTNEKNIFLVLQSIFYSL